MKSSRKLGWIVGTLSAFVPLSVALASATVYIWGTWCCAQQTCNGVFERVCTGIPPGECVGCSGGGQCEPEYQSVWVAIYNPCT